MRALIVVCSVVVAGCNCRGKPTPKPAPPRERAIVDYMLDGQRPPPDQLPGDAQTYDDVVAELERNPGAALLAIRERGATPGTKQALFLRALAHRLEDPRMYRARRGVLDAAGRGESMLGPIYPTRIDDLAGPENALFWAERLLKGGGMTERNTAIRHLDAMGGDTALDALRDAASYPGVAGETRNAADALALRGDERRVIEALATWDQRDPRDSHDEDYPSFFIAALAQLPTASRPAARDRLLQGLQAESATVGRRVLFLQALGVVGDEPAIERLVALRQTPWAAEVKSVIDAAIEAIARRAATPPAPPSPGGKAP